MSTRVFSYHNQPYQAANLNHTEMFHHNIYYSENATIYPLQCPTLYDTPFEGAIPALKHAGIEPSWRITTVKRKATTRVTGETGYVFKLSFYIHGKRVTCLFRSCCVYFHAAISSMTGRASCHWGT